MSTTLIKDVSTSPRDLAVYTTINGIAVDAYKVEIEVLDASTALPGSSLVARQTMTVLGKIVTGQYGVAPTGTAWKPTAACARGRCIWYITMVSGGDVTLIERSFEVVEASVARRADTGLALIQDIRDAGLVAGSYPSPKVHAMLIRWRDLIERVARQRFRPVYESRRIRSGGGSDLLHLPEQLVALAELRVNNSSTGTTLSSYINHADKQNPKIVIASSPDFYSCAGSTEGYEYGVDQVLTGLWGCVELSTYDPPEEIRQACILGVALSLAPTLSLGGHPGAGTVRSESTDGHSISYGLDYGGSRAGLLALLKEPSIRDAIMLYRAPISVRSPGG